MRLKDGVDLAGMDPCVPVGMVITSIVYEKHAKAEPTFTSVARPNGTAASLHFVGPEFAEWDGEHPEPPPKRRRCRAFDVRLPTRCVADAAGMAWVPGKYDLDVMIAHRLKEALGDGWDVVLETHQDDPFDWHIHVEYDPD